MSVPVCGAYAVWSDMIATKYKYTVHDFFCYQDEKNHAVTISGWIVQVTV